MFRAALRACGIKTLALTFLCMKHVLTEQVRGAGYEALFLVGGFAVVPAEAAMRDLDALFRLLPSLQSLKLQGSLFSTSIDSTLR